MTAKAKRRRGTLREQEQEFQQKLRLTLKWLNEAQDHLQSVATDIRIMSERIYIEKLRAARRSERK